jgi:putative PIN family toxin of toxin-antitoxin system
MKRGFEREYVIILSPEILDEAIDKLRHKFNVPENRIQDLIRILVTFSFVVEPTEKINAVKADPDDNKIIECAACSNADYIVSGDRHLLDLKEYKSIKIVTPRNMLEILN